MTIEKITTNKLYSELLPSGNGLVQSIIPSVPDIVTYRYYEAYKTNAAVGGFYHTELEVFDGATDETIVVSGSYSQLGLQGFVVANLYDDNTATQAFYTDTSGIGSYLRFDFGAGNGKALDKWRFYVNGAVTAIWDIRGSNDAVSWTTLATGLDCSGGAGWKEITW
jgi:hypothetical protein